MQREIDKSTVRARDLNTTLSVNRTSIQKISKGIEDSTLITNLT